MRTIKFRAWDFDKKVFIPNDLWAIVSTDFNAFGVMLKDWENYREGEYFYSNTQAIQQFTGLHSKSGREIYEGDLIQVCGNKNGVLRVEFVNGYVGGWVLTHPSTITPLSLGARATSEIEIVGNIFENPELLTK